MNKKINQMFLLILNLTINETVILNYFVETKRNAMDKQHCTYQNYEAIIGYFEKLANFIQTGDERL